MRNFSLAFTAALLLGTATAPALAQSDHSAHAAAASAKPRYGDFGLDLTAMDRSVKPGDNFWHFVNGNWDKSHRRSPPTGPAPAPEFSWSTRPSARCARSSRIWRSDPAKSGKVGQQVGDFYASWMDEAAIEARRHRAPEALSRPDRRHLAAAPTCISAFAAAGHHEPDRSRHPSRSGRSDPLHRRRRPGRPRPSQPRLLSARGREIRRDPQGLSRLCREDAAAGRDRRRRGQGRPDHRARDGARQGPLGAGPPARHQADLQSDEPRPARRAGAAVRMAGLPRGRRPRQRSTTVIAAEKSAITETGKMLDSVPLSTWKDYLAFHFVSSHANASAQGVRPGEFRLLLEDPARRSAAARALEARHPDDQRLARRGGRPDLCRAPLSGGEQPADGGADRQSARRPRGAPRRLDLDGRGDQGAGAGQARRLRPAHRPSGQVDRLFELRGEARRPARQRRQGRASSATSFSSRGSASRSTGRCGT